jgi:hypothetical protein
LIPALTVILGASSGYPAVRRTIQRLKRQTIAGKIEVIVVGFGASMVVPTEDAAPFHSLHALSISGPPSAAAANAHGFRFATAPIIAFGEDHCFPEPGWAEALLRAHQEPHAVVGPAFRNGNPGSATSWADFLIGYSPWMEPVPAGTRPFVPGHNSSYKRVELMAYADRLEEVLKSETVLHYDLARSGRTMYLEPAARVAHWNIARPGALFAASYHSGRVFAGRRAARWGLARRLFYSAASPLIPVVRFVRVARELIRPGRPAALLLRVAPLLAAALCADGFGQWVGYWSGPGKSAEALGHFEYNRVRYLTQEDLQQLAASDA